ncbi:glycosyltransferase family 4 protein [Paucibacter sp. AS339]|uniref:glycosyltransferase family 4 protein n=1 Tax=Paucibacter hankyongi TaxID=3133434 RepID=UPI0030A9AEF5
MMPTLAYVLHSGQLFGTERMALATLQALRPQFEGLIIAPPGPVHAAALAAGLRSLACGGRWAMLRALTQQLRRQPHSAVLSTGVWQALATAGLQALLGGRGAHLHMVHGGTDERLSYGRKRLLVGLNIRLVAVSDFVRQRLLAHGVADAAITVLPNFLPRPAGAASSPAWPPVRERLQRVILLSRLDRIKRVGLLFDALDHTPELRDLQFDIYGSGEEAELLQQRARRHPNVKLHGFVAEAAAELGRADLLLHTCPEEPFGLVLLEAFAAGVPVLVPNSGGTADIVRDGINGWQFSANDGIALGQRLRQLMQLPPAQLWRVSAGGRASLAKDYAAERLLPRLTELLRGAT